jgi:hypothetical protein
MPLFGAKKAKRSGKPLPLIQSTAPMIVPPCDYASAGDCRGGWSQTGTANVDVRGTPFTIARDQFVVEGYLPAGSTVFSENDQVVDLTGGGYCGGNSAANHSLQLVLNITGFI